MSGKGDEGKHFEKTSDQLLSLIKSVWFSYFKQASSESLQHARHYTNLSVSFKVAFFHIFSLLCIALRSEVFTYLVLFLLGGGLNEPLVGSYLPDQRSNLGPQQ